MAKQAFSKVTIALLANPRSGSADYILARRLMAEGKFQEAIAPALRASEALLDNVDADTALAECYSQTGDHDNAVKVMDKASRQHWPNYEVQGNFGIILARAGRHEEAIEPLKDGGVRPAVVLQLGRSLVELKRWDEARYIYSTWLKEDPKHMEVPDYFALAELYGSEVFKLDFVKANLLKAHDLAIEQCDGEAECRAIFLYARTGVRQTEQHEFYRTHPGAEAEWDHRL